MNSNTINSQSVRKWWIQPEDVVALLGGGLGHELGVANEFGVVDDLLDRAEVLVRPVECVLVLRRDQSCKLNEYVGPVTSVTR